MKTMGFPGYFLIVSDFIRAAREELGVMVGQDVDLRQVRWWLTAWALPRLTH